MKKFVLTVLILICAASTLQPVLAYVFTGSKWPSPTTSMYISIDAPWDDAFITAMSRWNQSTVFQFTYVSQFWDPCNNPNSPPRHNGVKFSDTLCGDAFGNSTLAVTQTWTTGGTTSVQSGIVFNTKWTWDVYDGPWSTGTFAGKSDFRRVAVHELGHVMGLDHEPNLPAIMAASVGTGNTIVAPTSDDIAGVNALYGGPAPVSDATGPALSITSHSNGQTVSTSSITLSGTATDSGRGDNGISSVTVNGVPATGGTATGSGTAIWSRTLTLASGATSITVVATDNSPAQNSTTSTITINYVPQAPPSGSGTASTYHVFPQYADGRQSDGTYYKSTLMISNPSNGSSADCTFRLNGMTVGGASVFTYNLNANGLVISPSTGAQTLQTGYATLQCSATVEAQLLYSYYAPNGAKISEATVFSSPSASTVQILADNREGGRIALAVANDSDQNVTYTVTAADASGNVVGTASLPLSARSNKGRFLDQLITNLPPNHYGQVLVSSNTGSASLIGIRYTGGTFTTIPETIRSSVGATARTYHIFPQYADGRQPDGSYYRTTVMVSNPSNSTTASCTLKLNGLTVGGVSSFSYNLDKSGWLISQTPGAQSLQTGYATLQCSANVEAQLLYSLYSPEAFKISEATVFSSPAAGTVQVLADTRETARLGLAIANDSDQRLTYIINAYDGAGTLVGSAPVILAARQSIGTFLDELMSLSPEYFGRVSVSGGAGTPSLIGIRFTGGAFTTIPETVQ